MALVLRHVVRRIRARWPRVEILVRGDSHYGRPEAMSWWSATASATSSASPATRCCSRRVADLAEDAALEPGRGRGREGPPLRRVPLCRQDLACRAAGHRPGRGLGAGQRQPVHRHQPRRRAALALRGRLLRPRPSRESDQGAQAPPRLRPDLVHARPRRTSSACCPHRRLLAPAHPARPGAQDLVLARRPVRHDPARPDQGRRPGHRDGHPDQGRPAVRLSLPGQPRRCSPPGPQAAALSRGAACPARARPRNPPTPIDRASGATARHARPSHAGHVGHPGE